MKVSFVIPVYNGVELTLRCVETLRNSISDGIEYEIIVVDDGSDQANASKLLSLANERTQVLRSESNHGYAAANNLGANAAEGELLALINNDLEFEIGWLEPMLRGIELRNVGIVGNVQFAASTGEIDHAGFLFDGKGQLRHKQSPNRRFGSTPSYSRFHAVTGACMLIRKSVYDKLGGFDELYENGCEDIDLCFKAQGKGLKILVANKSIIRHHVSSTRGPNSQRDERNMRRFQEKWRDRIKSLMVADWPFAYLEDIQENRNLFDWNCFKQAIARVSKLDSSPSPAGSLIVEAKLKRNERHWMSILDGLTDEMIKESYQTNAEQWLHSQFSYSGLETRSGKAKGRWIKERARIKLKSGVFVSSIQIEGEILPEGDAVEAHGQLGLRVIVNTAESKKYYPLDQGAFEINLEDLPDVPETDTVIELELAGVARTNAYAYLGRVTRKWFFLSRELRQFWKLHREQKKNQRLLIKRVSLNHETLLDFDSQAASPVNFDFIRRCRNIGINLIGWFDAELGVGESVRLAAKALDATTIKTNLVPLKVNCLASRGDTTFASRLCESNSYPINVFHIDAPQSADIDHHHGEQFRKRRRNIGYWAWELPEFPDNWIQYFAYFDEIWTPSNFVRDAIAIKSPHPVITIPHCIDFELPKCQERAKFNLPDDQFLFLFAYDLNSYQERKNPMATIRAFRQAFGGSQGKEVGLVIKTHSVQNNIEAFNELQSQLADIENIHLIEERLSRSDVYSLMNSVDAYVSLHRSEGFGLTVAESMFLGKPVISTNWSATSEFLDASNGCPVSFDLIELKQNFGPYTQGQVWADAHVDSAANYMRRLVNDSTFAKTLGANAAQTIRQRFSPEAIGKIYEKRIKSLALW